MSRSGYYKWIKRKDILNSYQKNHQQLDMLVADIHSHYPSQGYRQIRDTLLIQTGLYVCDKTVWRSMKRLNIKGYIRKRKYPLPSGNEHKRYPNILNREFSAQKPLEKLVTDVTYIRYKGKWYYLSCFMDLYNNEIVEWELGNVFDNFLVIKPAKRLLERAKDSKHSMLIHSDQGIQYASIGYCSLLKKHNVIQSMSRAGTPHDNAVMESFFGRFKDVLRSHYHYWKCDDLTQTISNAINYFNCKRPLRKLKGKPPVQYRIELAA